MSKISPSLRGVIHDTEKILDSTYRIDPEAFVWHCIWWKCKRLLMFSPRSCSDLPYRLPYAPGWIRLSKASRKPLIAKGLIYSNGTNLCPKHAKEYLGSEQYKNLISRNSGYKGRAI